MKTYMIRVDIIGVNPTQRDDVIQACTQLGLRPESFQQMPHARGRLTALQQIQIEQADEEFADSLARAVWTANQKAATIGIFAVPLNSTEVLIRDPADYREWREQL